MKAKLGTAGGFALAVMLAAPAVPACAAAAHRHAPARPKTAVHATAVRGVVVARNLARHTLVVSSAAGVVHTVRLASAPAVRRVPMGAEVLARSVLLGDGTYHALSVRAHGRAHRAKVRGTVVTSTPRRLLLSAGGSVFAIGGHARRGLRAHTAGTSTTPQAGDVVQATVSIGQSTVQQTQLQTLGQTGVIGLEGILQTVTTSSIVVAVDQGALTTITIPASLSLPSTIAQGDRVEVLAAYANQAFSLVTIKDDTLAATETGQGVAQTGGGESQNVEAEGFVVSVSPTSLVVQPGNGASQVTFTVPTGIDVSTIAAGNQVHARGAILNGVVTLTSVKVQQPEGDQGGAGNGQQASVSNTEVTGTVSSLDATSLVVQPNNGGTAVSFAIPTGFTLPLAVVAGGEVHVKGTVVSGVLTLASAEVPDSASVHVVGPVVSVSTTSTGATSTGTTSTGSTSTGSTSTGTTSTGTTSLVVQSSDNGQEVTFTVPATFTMPTGVVAGAQVNVRGTLVGGTPELTSLTVQQGD